MPAPRLSVSAAAAAAVALVFTARASADAEKDRPSPKPAAPKGEVVREAEFDIYFAFGDQAKAKVGTAVEKEVKVGDEVHISTDAKMSLGRGKAAVETVSNTKYVETAAGKLLRFSTSNTTSGPVSQNKVIEGKVDGKVVHLSVGDGKDARKKDVDWPEGAISPRDLERKMREGGLTVGKKFEAKVFPTPEDPEEAHLCKVLVEAKETIKFLDKDVEAFRVKTNVELFGQEITTLTWVDAKGDSYRVEMDMGNIKISFVRTK